MKPLQAWIKVAVYQTLLDDWAVCGGNRTELYARLKSAFEYAVGPEFDLSAYATLGSANELYTRWIRAHKLRRSEICG